MWSPYADQSPSGPMHTKLLHILRPVGNNLKTTQDVVYPESIRTKYSLHLEDFNIDFQIQLCVSLVLFSQEAGNHEGST